jgi:NAD(P)-dependent dehydrogenase (short-subunit alcohol dehydrogenase family)
MGDAGWDVMSMQKKPFVWGETVVAITGGASGIGLAISSKLHGLGAKLAICGRDERALEAAASAFTGAVTFACDVSQTSSVDAFIAGAIERFGRLDILVNNAAVPGVASPVEGLSDSDWDDVIAINLSGLFRMTRAAIPHIKASGGGSIVNIGSTSGSFGFPNRTAYASSKWAVVGFTKSLARELGKDRVRVNVVAPGITDGDRIRKNWANRAAEQGVTSEVIGARALSSSALGTLISPEEVADLVAYICSPSGRSITGQVLSVCGGTEWII